MEATTLKKEMGEIVRLQNQLMPEDFDRKIHNDTVMED